MRVRPLLAAGATASLAAAALGFHAVPEGGTLADAARDGDVVTFAGHADLPGAGAQEVPAFALTPFADGQAADAVGIDLVGATLEELEDASGLRFTWRLGSDLPPQGVPEGVRYTWTFDAGGETLQLQAKRTNVVSSTTAESPADHALEAAEGDWWFQLRGACVDGGGYPVPESPVSGCYHLGFFDGSVDTAAGTVSMDLPYEATDHIGRLVAGTFQRGTPITAQTSAGSSIAASLQAAISNATVSQFINSWGTYHPGTTVAVALGSAERATTGYMLLDTAGDGTFAGSLTGAGTHLWVRACTGIELQGLTDPCAVSSHLVD